MIIIYGDTTQHNGTACTEVRNSYYKILCQLKWLTDLYKKQLPYSESGHVASGWTDISLASGAVT
jgi:hypothetical protein